MVVLQDVVNLVDSILRDNEKKKIFPGICPGGNPTYYEIRSRQVKGFKEPKIFSLYYSNGSLAEVVIDFSTHHFISADIIRKEGKRTYTLHVDKTCYLTSGISLEQ